MLKTDLYSAIKSEDSEALDSGTSQLGSQRGFGVIYGVCLPPIFSSGGTVPLAVHECRCGQYLFVNITEIVLNRCEM